LEVKVSDFIYHYTTIEALASILSNKTIRFNSLRKVDDMEEAITKDNGNLQDYSFVSCWTKNKIESIPLWKMYSSDMTGIRIGVENNFLTPKHGYYSTNEGCFKIADSKVLNITNKDIVCLSYGFLRDVEYSDSQQSFLTQIDIRDEPPKEIPKFDSDKIATVKKKAWEFQDEVRFILHAMSESNADKSDREIYVFSKLEGKNKPNVDYIDMTFELETLKNMEILIGPKASYGCEIIINSLIEKYLPGYKVFIKKSELKIR
jgi:hypothetical protein